MKALVQSALENALLTLYQNQKVPSQVILVERTRRLEHGDFSTNIAFVLSKSLRKTPALIARQIATYFTSLQEDKYLVFKKVESTETGFINFFIHRQCWLAVLPEILDKKEQYGCTTIGKNESVLVEYVSSNPTGPLHVGHGRAAVHGDVIVRLLKTLGYTVHAEYYINDAGRQVDILTCSVWLRYLEICSQKSFVFPSNAYQGQYIQVIAQFIRQKYSDRFCKGIQIIEDYLTAYTIKEDIEQAMDKLILHTKQILDSDDYEKFKQFCLTNILSNIKTDLLEFGVKFDQWFSEQSLLMQGDVESMMHTLSKKEYTYCVDKNIWFRSTQFNDDKDRVLKRANNQFTYFAVDAAYRLNILERRKIKRIINLLGADHHGYLARIHAIVQALGYASEQIVFKTLQMVSLYRNGKQLPLSTRRGQFITLQQLRHEVGNDAARLFFLLKKSSQTIDFDLELAKKQSNQNPIYYLQYAYARICSMMRQLDAKHIAWNALKAVQLTQLLIEPQEINIVKKLAQYPDAIIESAMQYEPHLLVQYLRELVQAFHSYYNQTIILVQDTDLRNARLTLINSIKQILNNGFIILGIQRVAVM